MQLTGKTIRDIALEAPLTTRVFEEFKIDYCCGGRVDFAEACQKAGVDPASVEQKIEAVIGSRESTDGTIEQSATELADHIVQTHHVFTRTELNRLGLLMEKVCRKHGEAHPELFDIQKNFTGLNDELLPHMAKEEMILFPYIRELDSAVSRGRTVAIPHFGTVQNPVRMMMFEHDAAGEILRKMRDRSSDYKVPEGACPSFAALYAGLEDLEKDLHRHIHLENNVLFEQAIELEGKLSADRASQFDPGAMKNSGCTGSL